MKKTKTKTKNNNKLCFYKAKCILLYLLIDFLGKLKQITNNKFKEIIIMNMEKRKEDNQTIKKKSKQNDQILN